MSVPAVPVPSPAPFPLGVPLLVAAILGVATAGSVGVVAFSSWCASRRADARPVMPRALSSAVTVVLFAVTIAAVLATLLIPAFNAREANERNRAEFTSELTEAIEGNWDVTVVDGDVADVWAGRMRGGIVECRTFNESVLSVVCDGSAPPVRVD